MEMEMLKCNHGRDLEALTLEKSDRDCGAEQLARRARPSYLCAGVVRLRLRAQRGGRVFAFHRALLKLNI